MSKPAFPSLTVSPLLSALLVLIVAVLTEIALYSMAHDPSLERIKKRGSLIVLTENNANSYYLYRETPMGFEHDLARAFADYLGVALEIQVPGWNRLFDSLLSGQGDLIAAGIAVTREREALVAFSDSYLPVQQQVIVHKNNYTLETIHDLEGYTIHVRGGTIYETRLKQLQNEGVKLTILSHPDIPTEELIQLVAARQIPVTIANSNIALLNRRYYPDIKIAFPIAEEQHLAWAVRKQDKALLREINAFMKLIEKNGARRSIYNRYYAAAHVFDYVDLKKFHRRLKTRLPEYRAIIELLAEKYGFDWRLIAALIYQESHFAPDAISHTGALGLMQLTEVTAAELGITDRLDPVQNIIGGVRYLARLRARFTDIEDPHTRLLFALASYNIGYGHVRDAQQLACEMGFDGTSWHSLETTLPLLQNSEYYTTTIHGYARGTEPVLYVDRILTYYDILKQKSLPDSTRSPASARPDY